MSDFELRSAGIKYVGWTSIRVTRSIEELASSFTVQLTDLWHEGAKPVPLEAGDECEIVIDDEKIATGYIDENTLDYDANRRVLGFSGRSKTGDLIDCSALHECGQWRNSSLLRIAKDVCLPFGIDVSIGELSDVSSADLAAHLRRFSIQEGETAFATLDRLARMAGLLAVTIPDGNLSFERAGSTKVSTKLEYGVNILRGGMRNSWQDLHSIYVLKAQAAGDDSSYASASADIKRSSSNTDIVSRYRPIIIMAENEETGVELQKRADWDRNVRQGRAKRLNYTVRGWRHDDGLWSPNQLIKVVDPNARVDAELLITSVSQVRDNRGTFSHLSLSAPEAFDVQDLPTPKKKRGSFL